MTISRKIVSIRDKKLFLDYNGKHQMRLQGFIMKLRYLSAAMAVSILALSTAHAQDAEQSPPADWVKKQKEIRADPSITFFGTSPEKQQAIMKQSGKFHPVVFHKAETGNEWKLVSGFYGKYLNQHKDIHLETAVLDLNGSKIGSIFVRFVSAGTCVNSSCLTNIITFSSAGEGVRGAREDRSWHEVWSRHTENLYVGPPSPTLDGSDGQNMSEIMGDDHVLWRWVGPPYSYYPEIFSIGRGAYPWKMLKVRDDNLRETVSSDFPTFFSTTDPKKSDAIYASIFKDRQQEIVAVQYMGSSACGQVGCPMTLYSRSLTDGVGNWVNISGDTPININDSAIAPVSLPTVLPRQKASVPALAVKDANFISLWNYEAGRYHRYAQIVPVLPQEN